MTRARALTANMLAVTLGKAATVAFGLLAIALLTRHLGPTGYGYYRTVLTYAAFASILADLGLYMIVLREISNERFEAPRVLGNALLLRLVSTGGVLLAGAFVALALPYDPVVRQGIFLGGLIYIAIQGSELLVTIFQKTLKQGRAAAAEALGGLTTLALVWVLAHLGAGMLAMLAATAGGSGLTFALSWYLGRRLIPFRPCLEPAVWRYLVVAGLPLAGSHVIGLAILRGDTLLLSLLQPAAEVGLYGVPSKIFEIAVTLAFLFGGLMMPLLVAARGDDAGFAGLLAHACNTMAMFGIGTVVALAVFAEEIVVLVAGAEFAAAAPALVVLAFAAAVTAVSLMLRFAVIAVEQPGRVLQADGLGLVVAAVAYLTLIPRFSFMGAAVGTLLAEATILGALAWALGRSGRPLPPLGNTGKALLAGALTAGLLWGLGRLGLPWLLALGLGGAVYLAVLALTGAIPRAFLVALAARSKAADL